jgi:hypothetical protein
MSLAYILASMRVVAFPSDRRVGLSDAHSSIDQHLLINRAFRFGEFLYHRC